MLTLEHFFEQHALVVAVAVPLVVIFIAIPAFFIALIGNWRHRRRIRAKYECEPTEFPPQMPVEQIVAPPTECRKCGYNLTGNTSGICPECGTPIARNHETDDSDLREV